MQSRANGRPGSNLVGLFPCKVAVDQCHDSKDTSDQHDSRHHMNGNHSALRRHEIGTQGIRLYADGDVPSSCLPLEGGNR
jgi:hypothetical protein